MALLTIGSCLPIVSFVRTADRLRRDIAALVTTPHLLWVEYQAPQDVLNAFGFEPVRDLKLDIGAAPQLNPRIRSARFKETLLPATYRKIRWNFFRVHFHFLMANEVPGEYDYLMIACGPVQAGGPDRKPASGGRGDLRHRIGGDVRGGSGTGGRTGRLRRAVRQQHRQASSPGRKVSRQTGSTTAPGARSSRARCARVAMHRIASVKPNAAPAQTRGPMLNGI